MAAHSYAYAYSFDASTCTESCCSVLAHSVVLALSGEVADLRAEIEGANAQIQQMHADLQAWEEAVTARDTELRNLQVCSCWITLQSVVVFVHALPISA